MSHHRPHQWHDSSQTLLCEDGSTSETSDLSLHDTSTSVQAKRRAFLIRILALLCTCSLSIGSHYASYVLGPLKSRFLRDLGTSNTEFSLLISAFTLNSTWTPLVGGVMASRLGTTVTSIFASGIILAGTILLLIGEIAEDMRLMAFGMFIFGLGISPLSVVQETIIVRFFKSHGLGMSMAFGLIAGKLASFISVRTSYPLTHHFGPSAPFYVATFLAAFSVVVNLVYVSASKWLVHGADAELEASDIGEPNTSHSLSEADAMERTAAKRKVDFSELSRLGDVFWVYAWLNVLAGTLWTPFTHLAANIIEQRYNLTEGEATRQASYLLAGSLVLYPICGYLVDRHKERPIIMQLFMLSSVLTLCCYSWLALPPEWTKTALPAVMGFGSGYGFSPLIVVLLAAHIVPSKYVSTALGIHKSLEQTGSTIFQTLAGLSLDIHSGPHKSTTGPEHRHDDDSIQYLLNTFVFLNVIQFLGILFMDYLDKRKKTLPTLDIRVTKSLPTLDVRVTKSIDDPTIDERIPPENQALLSDSSSSTVPYPHYSATSSWMGSTQSLPADQARTNSEVRRGEVFIKICGGMIVFAWVLFLTTAWLMLRSKEERGF